MTVAVVRVRAVRRGFYGVLRHVGDVFEVEIKDLALVTGLPGFETGWMSSLEPVPSVPVPRRSLLPWTPVVKPHSHRRGRRGMPP
jgi:hypothetical protein